MSGEPAFAELLAATNYSFLRGANHAADMVMTAIDLGHAGIGIADRNTVAGVVKAYVARKEAIEQKLVGPDFRLVVGARLAFVDGTPDIVAYPANRRGWGHLTRLLTLGNREASKGDCKLDINMLIAHAEDLLLIAVADESHEFLLRRLARHAPLWIAATMSRQGADHRRLARLDGLSRRTGIPLLATCDALYATPEQRPLHDVITCIREGTTIADAGHRLLANAERHLKDATEMTRLFRQAPKAVAAWKDVLGGITFTLDDLRYEYPHEPVPEGWEPQGWLEHETIRLAREKYPEGIPDATQKLLDEEFQLIRNQKYAYYFLTVYEAVKFAREQCDPPILCQGRGSAANSVVCYMLGITSIDPVKHKLLFSRFVSSEREEPPDIDVDFEHERREEVIQHIYGRYKRHRSAIAATVIHYRPRSAVREVGKVLGISEDVTARLTSTVWGSFADRMETRRFTDAGFDLEAADLERLRWIVDQLLTFPRHLGQHVGGFVLTEDRLDETVPIHNAAMPDRTFIEWDKDDIEALKLMKVDVLALGMLTCIRKGFTLLEEHGFGRYDLDTIQGEEPVVYAMLQAGDSIGVFQVESRAQINMLPRLKPECFYDLAVQVAIVRPGPIEGDMVHPYLRRREEYRLTGKKPDFPRPGPGHNPDELREVLGETFGVPLFQEQAMKLAITAAGFTNEEANQLRRAMATFKHVGTIGNFEEKMVEGMVARGYERDFAQRCYNQIKGFGSYGFPESHALSFARLVYVSSWIKAFCPAVFAAALLNSQPMGFYAPAQIVRDAAEHGVAILRIDVNRSGWDNAVEAEATDGDVHKRWTWGVAEHRKDKGFGLRLGFRQIDGFREDWGHAIAAEREASGPFTSIEEIGRRVRVPVKDSETTTPLPARALRLLADADACGSLDLGRRQAAWEVRRMPGAAELPLFAAARARELAQEPDAMLPAMPLSEEVTADYQTTRLSLKQHPIHFLRATLRRERILSAEDLLHVPNGQRAKVAGVVLVRQRPGKGNAIFATLEDETGIVNILLWARMLDRYRRALMASRLMEAHGLVQKSKEGVIHLMADRIVDRTGLLDLLGEEGPPPITLSRADVVAHPQVPRGRHPRDVRIIPKSRDFH